MNNKKETSHNFWSGFSLGMIAGGVILYGVATKKGRSTVKKILDNTETLEGNMEDILTMIQKNVFTGENNEEKNTEKESK